MSESPAPLPSAIKQSNQPSTRARFTDSERHALRAHYHLLTTSGVPTPQSHLSNWFHTTFGHPISQSQISKILSARYAHLDAPPKLPDNCRNRAAAHPELDTVLGEWYAKAKADGVKVSGDDLREMARRFWQEGRGGEGEMPKFSNGWLEGFKHRHGVERKKYNKDPSKAHMSKNEKEKARLQERMAAKPLVKAGEALKALETLDDFFNQRNSRADEDQRKWVKGMLRNMREMAREEERIARQMAMDSIDLTALRSTSGNASQGHSHPGQANGVGRQALGNTNSTNHNMNTVSDNGYVPPEFPLQQQRPLPQVQPPQQQQRIDPRLESMNAPPYAQRYDTPSGGVASLHSWIMQHDGNH